MECVVFALEVLGYDKLVLCTVQEDILDCASFVVLSQQSVSGQIEDQVFGQVLRGVRLSNEDDVPVKGQFQRVNVSKGLTEACYDNLLVLLCLVFAVDLEVVP